VVGGRGPGGGSVGQGKMERMCSDDLDADKSATKVINKSANGRANYRIAGATTDK
jgi:hypothetical protein